MGHYTPPPGGPRPPGGGDRGDGGRGIPGGKIGWIINPAPVPGGGNTLPPPALGNSVGAFPDFSPYAPTGPDAIALVYGQAIVTGRVIASKVSDYWYLRTFVGICGTPIDSIVSTLMVQTEKKALDGSTPAPDVLGASGTVDNNEGTAWWEIVTAGGTPPAMLQAWYWEGCDAGTWQTFPGLAYLCYTQPRWKGALRNLWQVPLPLKWLFLVKGKKVYDPRKDSTMTGGSGTHRLADPTTWEQTSNAALNIQDFAIDRQFGCKSDPALYDYAALMVAADACDEDVDGSPRYTLDISIDTEGDSDVWMSKLLLHCAGRWAVQPSGLLGLVVDAATTETAVVLDETNTRPDSTRVWEVAENELPNRVVVEYPRADLQWTTDRAVWEAAELIAGTEKPREQVYQLQGIVAQQQAFRCARWLGRSQRWGRGRAETIATPAMARLQVGSRVNLTGQGVTNAPFRITTREPIPDTKEIKLGLSEYDAAVFSDDPLAVDTPLATTGSTGLPNSWDDPPDVTGFDRVGGLSWPPLFQWDSPRTYRTVHYGASHWAVSGGPAATWDAAKVNDGDTATLAFEGASPWVETTVTLDLGAGNDLAMGRLIVIGDALVDHCPAVAYSDDNVTFTYWITTGQGWYTVEDLGSGLYRYIRSWPTPSAHRYWRWNMGGGGSAGCHVYELQWGEIASESYRYIERVDVWTKNSAGTWGFAKSIPAGQYPTAGAPFDATPYIYTVPALVGGGVVTCVGVRVHVVSTEGNSSPGLESYAYSTSAAEANGALGFILPPSVDGSAGWVLTTDGAGQTAFAAVSTLPAGDADTVDGIHAAGFDAAGAAAAVAGTLSTHAGLSTTAHGGIVASSDARLTDARNPLAHALVGSAHSASGLTTGHFLKALSATTFGFAAHGLTYADVGALAAGATAVDSDKLDGQHGSYYQTALTNPVTGTGTPGYVPKFTAGSALGNSIISESAGLISIGGSLDVSDGTRHSRFMGRGTAAGTGLEVGIDVLAHTSGATLNLAGSTVDGASGGGVNIAMYSSGDWRRALSIKNGGNLLLMPDGFGNVGIGTASPLAKTHVDLPTKTGAAQTVLLLSLSDSTLPLSPADSLTLDIGKIYAGRDYRLARLESSNDAVNDYSNGYLAFSTTRSNVLTEAVRITSGGNVGIGTVGPLAPLHQRRDTTGDSITAIFTSHQAAGAQSQSFVLGSFLDETSGARLKVLTDYSGDSHAYLSLQSRDYAGTLYDSIFLKGSNVGIGTVSPAYTCDVNGSLHAADLYVAMLVAQNKIATIGGRVLVGPTTFLTADLLSTGADSTWPRTKHNSLAVGDIVYLESAPAGVQQTEWLAIIGGPFTEGDHFYYQVTRNLDGSGANNWLANDAVFDTGTTNAGFIDLYSRVSMTGGNSYGPTIVGNVRTGTTWSNIEPRWAIGNLRNLYGYSSGADLYGCAFGSPSGAWVKIDPTNGVRLGYNTTTHVQVDSSGNASFSGSITATSGTIAGWTIDASKLANSADTLRLNSAGSIEARATSVYPGGGVITAAILDTSGFTCLYDERVTGTDYQDYGAYKIADRGGTVKGALWGSAVGTSGVSSVIYLGNPSDVGVNHQTVIRALSDTGIATGFASVQLYVNASGGPASFEMISGADLSSYVPPKFVFTGGPVLLAGSSSGQTGFQAPAAAGAAIYTLPGADGAAGDVLSTNGSATLSWIHAVPTGTVLMFGNATAPTGYHLCDGTAISRSTYAALFAVIGTTFGVGDNSTTFNVPNLQGRFPLGKATSGTGSTLGGTGGTIDHVHSVDPPSKTTSGPSATSSYGLGPGSDAAHPTHTHSVDIAAFDSAAANPPFQAVVFIIKL